MSGSEFPCRVRLKNGLSFEEDSSFGNYETTDVVVVVVVVVVVLIAVNQRKSCLVD